MNQYVKKLIASILFVFPLLMVTSVFADVEKTSESTQSENQSFDKTTFSEELITSETTESQSEAPTSNTRQEENKTSETSEVAEQTSDSSEEVQVRVVSADGYSEAATTEELTQLLAD